MGPTPLVVGLLLIGTRGCFGYESNPPPDDTGTEWIPLPGAVDLLVVVDNSPSMAQEQESLTAAFPRMIAGLVSPPDLDGDGAADYPPVTDLHVGVVSSDMGTGGFAVQTCRDATNGDDGILRNSPTGVVAGCDDSYPAFLQHAEGDDGAALVDDFACIASLGTTGCGFEQPLGSMRAALTEHRDGANEGFLREGSVLAVLVVSDDDDCTVSADGTDLFDTQEEYGALNLRCHRMPDRLEPLETLVDAIFAARPGHSERVILAGVLGIPTDAQCDTGDMTAGDFDCLLSLPDMDARIDEGPVGRGEALVASCDIPGMGEAYPPRRFLEAMRLVSERGGSANVQSICQSDWDTALSRIALEIRSHVQ